MRRKLPRKRKTNAGRLMGGILLGGIVGATVRWWIASVSGEKTQTRRRLEERIKTSEGNIESQARELVEEVTETTAKF